MGELPRTRPREGTQIRQQLSTDTVDRYMAATPEALYDMVADVTRMPELSPEVEHCEWIGGATGPAVGARFRARNSVGRGPDWHNKPVVTVADRGREFVFERTEPFAGTVQWGYRFEPEGAGTRVTEWYRVTKELTIVGWFIIGGIYGLKDRTGDVRRGMLETLERLAVVAESPTTGSPMGGPLNADPDKQDDPNPEAGPPDEHDGPAVKEVRRSTRRPKGCPPTLHDRGPDLRASPR